jgi:hypothetical protein
MGVEECACLFLYVLCRLVVFEQAHRISRGRSISITTILVEQSECLCIAAVSFSAFICSARPKNARPGPGGNRPSIGKPSRVAESDAAAAQTGLYGLMSLERQLRCGKCGTRRKTSLDLEFRPSD